MTEPLFTSQYIAPTSIIIARSKHFSDQQNSETIFKEEPPLDAELISAREILKPVTELFLGGGGGAGRALPSAFSEAVRFGLDLSKVKVICATSVGTIMGLGILLHIPAEAMGKVLDNMPTDRFQDWSLKSIFRFFTHWGFCAGKEMPDYFRKLIKDHTGLEDPTFLELYQAGYQKEFRVVTANVSQHKIVVFSHKNTPHKKVADTVALACSVPLVFPPHWIPSEQGHLEAYTDGGVLKNYPWGVGSDPDIPIEEQLGFTFVNKGANYGIKNNSHGIIDSFWGYFCKIFAMIVFQDPMDLDNQIRQRTVAIRVNHNPLNFNATPQEQRALDEAGRDGVRQLVKDLIAKQKKGHAVVQHHAREPITYQFSAQKRQVLPQQVRHSERLRNKKRH